MLRADSFKQLIRMHSGEVSARIDTRAHARTPHARAHAQIKSAWAGSLQHTHTHTCARAHVKGGFALDNWAAVSISGDNYTIVSRTGRPGSVIKQTRNPTPLHTERGTRYTERESYVV